MFATIDPYPDGIVTYPGTTRTNLGLQWHLGSSYKDVKTAVGRFASPDTTIILGVFSKDVLWACLVLGIDADKRTSLITMADLSELSLAGDWKAVAKELVSWANGKFSPCSLGMFTDLDSAKVFLSSENKLAAIKDLTGKDKLVVDPLPKPLEQALAAI